jgi:acetolactate synthase I/II/III large subunit
MKNAELIVRMLEEAGTRWVFGIPSGPVLPLIEALRPSPVDYVLVANEATAGFMATVVGALTGSPGACAATVGPGATNLTTGVGAAWLDRAPVLAFTCNVPSTWLDRRIQMRIDHNALFRPLTKATYTLTADGVGETMAAAISLACAEPPGPVHLDLPEDVSAGPARGSVPSHVRRQPNLPNVCDELSRTLSEALARSRRPIVLTGLSFTRSQARDSLLRFIENQQIPFVTTLHAKGFLPESHPNWAGVIGRARRTDVQKFVNQADLVIAVGYDVIEINYEEWIGKQQVIHVDTEPAEVGPAINVLANLGGDLDREIEVMA